jgi:hypothetical protein
MSWLRAEHPELGGRYAALYRGGAYASRDYQRAIAARVRELAERYGVGRRATARGATTPRRGATAGRRDAGRGGTGRGVTAAHQDAGHQDAGRREAPEQLTLL